MKATLEFNLPEDEEEFNNARSGVCYKIALSELDNYLRSKIKYEEHSDEVHSVYEEVRKKLHEYCEEYEVTL